MNPFVLIIGMKTGLGQARPRCSRSIYGSSYSVCSSFGTFSRAPLPLAHLRIADTAYNTSRSHGYSGIHGLGWTKSCIRHERSGQHTAAEQRRTTLEALSR